VRAIHLCHLNIKKTNSSAASMVAPLSIIENYIKPSHWSASTYPGISEPLLFRTDLAGTDTHSAHTLHGAWINKSGVYSQIFLIFVDVVQLQNMWVFYELQNSYFSLYL